MSHGRSSSAAALDQLIKTCEHLADENNAAFTVSDRYPGWEPNADSSLLNEALTVYRELFNEEPKVECIHAGLETGIIGDKIGSKDLLSYGPTIINAHSPDERLNIQSLNQVYRFLKALVTSGGV